jgi:hypothetical protein
MPKISFTFIGHVSDAIISEAWDDSKNTIDVSKMSGEELAKKLQDGELFISFSEAYADCQTCSCEMDNFESEE